MLIPLVTQKFLIKKSQNFLLQHNFFLYIDILLKLQQ